MAGTDLIEQAWDAAPTLANVGGVEYRTVGVVYSRLSADVQPYPFASLPEWDNTAPGQIATQAKQIATQAKELAELRSLLAARADDLVAMRTQLEAMSELAALAEKATAPATVESAPLSSVEAPAPEAPTADDDQPHDRVADLTEVEFLLEGIKGIPHHLKSIAATKIGTLPFEEFAFGDVSFKPSELQDTIARMVAGEGKTVVLKAMPGFSNNKYSIYSETYKAIGARIKPAAGTSLPPFPPDRRPIGLRA